jgi:hypothetical protein
MGLAPGPPASTRLSRDSVRVGLLAFACFNTGDGDLDQRSVPKRDRRSSSILSELAPATSDYTPPSDGGYQALVNRRFSLRLRNFGHSLPGLRMAIKTAFLLLL